MLHGENFTLTDTNSCSVSCLPVHRMCCIQMIVNVNLKLGVLFWDQRMNSASGPKKLILSWFGSSHIGSVLFAILGRM
jgi:hypothetical protein